MKIFHASNLQVHYQNGFLRYLRLGNAEVLRMLYFAVRDQNWNTMPLQIKNEKIKNEIEDSFVIEYEAHCQQNEIDFLWNCKVEGREDGSITFEVHGKAESDFLRNRIGCCISHPIRECAGQSVWITHLDGTEQEYAFPKLISPHQPFKNIQAMRWQVAGATANLHFFGDTFEIEDQRNWMDASYKTYCTPLDLPFPVQVQKGDEVRQRVEFKMVQSSTVQSLITETKRYTLSESGESHLTPPLSLEANTESLDDFSVERLKNLNLTFLRIEMRLHEPEWEAGFEKRTQQAKALQLPVQLVLFLNANWTKEQTILKNHHFKFKIYKIILVNINNKTLTADFLNQTLPFLKTVFRNVPIGGGTNAYFTEFNRNSPPANLLDFASFSVNPQVHAFDDESLIENLETPMYIIESARYLVNLPLSVSPITLRPRFNPDATTPEKMEVGQMPFRVDVRQRTSFGAAWTLGSLLAFAKTAVQDLTYFQTVGEEGVLMPDRNSQYTDFEAVAQDIFPMYAVFELFGQFKGGTVEVLESSHPLVVAGGVLKKEGREQLILVNYTAEAITIQCFGQSYLLHAYQILTDYNGG
jgi:hypothetical protein